jgi:hypothetical protein
VRVSSATALAGAAAVVGADVFPAGEATGAGALSVVYCEEAGSSSVSLSITLVTGFAQPAVESRMA